MTAPFGPGDKVRRKPECFYGYPWEGVFEVEWHDLITHEVLLVDPPNFSSSRIWSADAFELVTSEKVFGTLKAEDIKVGEEYWPITDGQKESNEVTTEITEAHRKDIQFLADELFRKAADRDGYSEWEAFVHRVNKTLIVKLEPTHNLVEKFWTEFSFQRGDVFISPSGRTRLRVGYGPAWHDDDDLPSNDYDSAIRGRLIRGTGRLYRNGIRVTPPES